MKVDQFIVQLESRGITLWLDGDQLRYQAVKHALTPELRDEIVAHKADILTFLRQSQQGFVPPLQPLPRDGQFHLPVAKPPLSFAQQRLWFLYQLEGPSPTFNVQTAVRLTGLLDLEALEKSLSEMVRRHEILRTTFRTQHGEPYQHIEPPSRVRVPAFDLCAGSEVEQEVEIQRLGISQFQEPFDFEQGPLWRMCLLSLGPYSQVFFLTIHHIITDAWSMGIFLHELSALYQAYRRHEPVPLPELHLQYADYAAWQRTWLAGDVLDTQLAYWQEQLADAPHLLNLPTDYPRPAMQSYRGAYLPIALPKALTERLKQLGQRTGTTLFMVLQTTFAMLLARYSGQADILIGTPIANRQLQELEGLIGFFINTLVLRNDLSGNPPFSQLLARVRQVVLGAYEHPALPFELLVEGLQPQRTLSHSPLFQAMFVLYNNAEQDFELAGLKSDVLEIPFTTAQLDLTLGLRESAEGLVGWFEYSSDLFEPKTLERMAGHFEMLLEGIVANPDQPIGDLTLLTEAERHQILVAWNATACDYPKDWCLHHGFEAQVERTPDAVAVVCPDPIPADTEGLRGEVLTYLELNAKCNQLAHELLRRGVEPGVLVGIYMERSVDMLVGVLGILKAGGAYVPLDPSFPPTRLQFMVDDAQVHLLLTQSALVETQPPPQTRQRLCLDQLWDAPPPNDGANPMSPVQPSELAYCIYTSGSTGEPKGVQITHRNVVNFLQSMQTCPGLTAHDTLLAVTTLSFDISVLELLLPLTVGAKLVIAPREATLDGRRLQRLLQDANVTVMQATPSTWRLLLAAGWPGASNLRILCGGEALPHTLAEALTPRCDELWNMYGPTETTIWSTIQQVSAGASSISIGRPIANTRIYILDPQMRPVPMGVVGDLYIAGDGLALGYWKRPQLTQERFITVNGLPHAGAPTERLYQTGDLARYLPNGELEFLGRSDDQVKIRGFRIELGEIETVLSQHPEVREAVVVVHDMPPDDQRLVAYAVASEAVELNSLRVYLAEKLPDYMIPHAVVRLDTLPLTANGKINRRALPAPVWGTQSGTDFVLPHTETERQIAAIWQSVLQLEKVGSHDNFFELGGHSILMTQVHWQLRETIDRELSIVVLFQYPTIHTLARYINPSASEHDAAQVPSDVMPSQVQAEMRRSGQSNARQQRLRREEARSTAQGDPAS